MWSVIVFIIIAVLIIIGSFFICKHIWGSFEIWENTLILSFISIVVFACLYIVIGCWCTPTSECVPVESWSQKIVSVSLDNDIEGDFCIGTGYIKDTLYYYYAYVTSDGGYKIDKVPVNSTTVYYVEDDFKVVIYDYEYPDNKTTRYWGCAGDKIDRHSYKMYVPEGTIVEEYSIQL